MPEFVGNGHETLCVTASRGHLFVPVEDDEGKKTWHMTRRGKIVSGIAVTVLAVLLLSAIVLLSIDWAQLPKYKELNSMLGSGKAEVEDKLPDKVRYAGAQFEVIPTYENDIFVGFQYETTFRSKPAEAADVSLETIEYLTRMFGEPNAAVPEISEIEQLTRAFNGDDVYCVVYRWDMRLLEKNKPYTNYVARKDPPDAGNWLYMELDISYHPSADDVHIKMVFTLGEEPVDPVMP